MLAARGSAPTICRVARAASTPNALRVGSCARETLSVACAAELRRLERPAAVCAQPAAAAATVAAAAVAIDLAHAAASLSAHALQRSAADDKAALGVTTEASVRATARAGRTLIVERGGAAALVRNTNVAGRTLVYAPAEFALETALAPRFGVWRLPARRRRLCSAVGRRPAACNTRRSRTRQAARLAPSASCIACGSCSGGRRSACRRSRSRRNLCCCRR